MASSALTRRFIGAGAAGGAVLAVGAMLLLAGAASADQIESGDARATAHAGNVTTCAAAGLDGSEIDVTSSISDGTYIDVTAVPDGVTVTGVVVKGGPNYNVYLPGSLGSLPWLDLHSPLNPNGKPAGISHWFVCGTEGGTTTTTTTTEPTSTTTTEETTTTTESTTTTEPTTPTTTTTDESTTTTTEPTTTTTDDCTTTTTDESTTTESTTTDESSTTTDQSSTTTDQSSTTTDESSTTTPSASSTPSSTSSTTAATIPVVNTPTPGSQGGLAYTGFGAGWLVPAGAALLVLGSALLVLARRRSAGRG